MCLATGMGPSWVPVNPALLAKRHEGYHTWTQARDPSEHMFPASKTSLGKTLQSLPEDLYSLFDVGSTLSLQSLYIAGLLFHASRSKTQQLPSEQPWLPSFWRALHRSNWLHICSGNPIIFRSDPANAAWI